MRRIVRLKGIKVVNKADGRRYIYRRVGSQLIPLPNLPENHPDFLTAYQAAELVSPKSRHARRSIGALIEVFIGSRDFAQRKDSTRAVWRRRLDKISQDYGVGQVADLRPEHIRKVLRKLSPGAVRSERTIWRALMAFAVEEDWRHDNPAASVTVPKYESFPHEPWTHEDIAMFREKWPIGTGERQAMEVIYWTGARCVDAACLGWQQVNSGILEFKQEKTGGIAVVPISAPVDNFLQADQNLFLACLPGNLTWILTANGKPRSVKGLSNMISKAAKDASLVKKTAHGLRKARATQLANNGWTPHRIGAWTGHESLKEIAHYTRSVDKRKLVVRTEQDRNNGNSNRIVSINQEKPN